MKLVRSHFVAHVDVPASATILVMDARGKVLRQFVYSASTDFDELLDLSGLQSGVYILQCNVGDKHAEEKIVIK